MVKLALLEIAPPEPVAMFSVNLVLEPPIFNILLL